MNRLVHLGQIPSANVVLLAIGGAAALLLELHVIRKKRRIIPSGFGFHFWASWLGLVALALMWAAGPAISLSPPAQPDWMMWTALAAIGGLFVVRLFDQDVREPIAGVYLSGLLAALFTRAYVPAELSQSLVGWSMVLGAYSIVAALVGACGVQMLARENRRRAFLLHWLRICSAAIAAVTVFVAINSDWNEPMQSARLIAAIIALVQSVGLGLIAEEDAGTQAGALIALAAGMVAVAWAVLPAHELARPLDLASVAIGALSLFTAFAGAGSGLSPAPWRTTIRWAIVAALAAMALGTVGVVAAEAMDGAAGMIPLISRTAVIGITCELAVALASAVAAAAKRLPGISAAGRSACVWAAEAVAVLAFIHLRVAEPWLFSHRLEAFWPMVVLAIAFGLLAGGFALNRAGRAEIGKPLEYSGIALPMVAIIGYWLHPSVVDYAAVLWIAGVLYALVAAMRRSLPFTLVAAACANVALWDIFAGYPQYGFFVHPQLWIIPAGLSVLAAVQIHRPALNDEQMRTVRYLCLAVIYLASTADIVLNGVMVEPWLPMVLAALAIAGALAGIMWRIRPFLYLGMAFLLIAVITMIWTAQANWHWTWLWYVAGLSAGIALLAVFGLFEKRHEQMIRLVESLRQWQ